MKIIRINSIDKYVYNFLKLFVHSKISVYINHLLIFILISKLLGIKL